MAKLYRSNWSVKPLEINFNQKQWRQDFGAYVKDKLFWSADVKVSRARAEKGPSTYAKVKGVKSFEVYNTFGGSVVVHFENNNKIISSNREDLINSYLEERGYKK